MQQLCLPISCAAAGAFKHLDPGNPDMIGVESSAHFLVEKFGKVFRGGVDIAKFHDIIEPGMVQLAKHIPENAFYIPVINTYAQLVKPGAPDLGFNRPVVAVKISPVSVISPKGMGGGKMVLDKDFVFTWHKTP